MRMKTIRGTVECKNRWGKYTPNRHMSCDLNDELNKVMEEFYNKGLKPKVDVDVKFFWDTDWENPILNYNVVIRGEKLSSQKENKVYRIYIETHPDGEDLCKWNSKYEKDLEINEWNYSTKVIQNDLAEYGPECFYTQVIEYESTEGTSTNYCNNLFDPLDPNNEKILSKFSK